MAGCAGRFGGLRRRLRALGFECILLPGSGEALDGSYFNNVVGCSVAGHSLTSVGGGGWGSHGAETSDVAAGDCEVIFTAGTTNQPAIVGFSLVDADRHYISIDYGSYADPTGNWFAWERFGGGSFFGPFAGYALGDEFKVQRVGGVVTWWKRTPPGAWVFGWTSAFPSVGPVRGDAALTGTAVANDITLTGFTSYRRVSSAQDFARRNKTFAMAIDGRRPAFIPGDPCAWRFETARSDSLIGPVLPLGPGSIYTAVLVAQLKSLPPAAAFFALYGNGSVFVDGPSTIVEGAGAISTKAYHWGPAVTVPLHVPSDLILHSSIVRYDGANLLSRFDGGDAAPAAIAAPAAPTVESVIGAANSAGILPSDDDLLLFAWAPRSLSAGDIAELSAILDAGWSDKTERIADADMEAAGAVAWPAIDANCTSAKAAPGHTGAQCLRVTTVVPVGFAAAIQGNIWPQGMRVRLRGWARGDGLGVSVPVMYLSGALALWAGTNSNAWQPFDVTFTAAYPNNRLDLGTTQLSGYVEFDDLQSEQVL